MRNCALCGRQADGDEHHLIPKKFEPFIGENLDKYRIVLCSACHRKVTRLWNKFFFKFREVFGE
jgi:5-methylcytosine-specific restriction endonuclease McrA